jgi:hypothetical protein
MTGRDSSALSNELDASMDQDSVKLGLLMESAQTHQKLAETAIEKLSQHTQSLEAAVRDQIQRALVDALKTVHAESQRAVDALQKIKTCSQCAGYAVDAWPYSDISRNRSLRRLVGAADATRNRAFTYRTG